MSSPPNDIFWFVQEFNSWHSPRAIKMSTITLALLEKALLAQNLITGKGDPKETEARIYGLKINIDNTLMPGEYKYEY